MVNLNVRLSDSDHQKLVGRCASSSCDKSKIVRDALRSYLNSEESNPSQEPKNEALADVFNMTSACYHRYGANGQLLFHLIPTERTDAIQYYSDTLNENSATKWYWRGGHGWIQVVQA